MPSRAFSLDEIRSFASLAGDHNPLHVDPIAARRTLLGAPVVHGMLLTLWALDELAAREPRPRALRRVEATFSKAVVAGETIELSAAPSREGSDEAAGEGGVTVTLRRNGALRASIRIEWDARPPAEGAPLPLADLRDEPRALSFDEAALASGEVPLTLDRPRLDALFPHLSRVVAAEPIAVVLATSRIVGMKCPGLHSIYAKLDVRFEQRAEHSGGAPLGYRVERSNKRFSKLEIRIASPTATGTIEAFFRPPPVRQIDMAEAARLVAPTEFEGRRALVIGGSRGLGEATAKLVAAGGGDVRLTYHAGRDDAERVVSEIQAAGGRAACLAYDVLAPEKGIELGSFRPSHLYYFATKVISFGERQAFSPALFRDYCAYYVDGFAAVVERVAKAADGSLEVLYPSSVFVDRIEPGAAEYAAAKAAGEIVGANLAARIDGLKVVSPRLLKVRTDQTASLGPLAAERPETVMLSVLRGA